MNQRTFQAFSIQKHHARFDINLYRVATKQSADQQYGNQSPDIYGCFQKIGKHPKMSLAYNRNTRLIHGMIWGGKNPPIFGSTSISKDSADSTPEHSNDLASFPVGLLVHLGFFDHWPTHYRNKAPWGHEIFLPVEKSAFFLFLKVPTHINQTLFFF